VIPALGGRKFSELSAEDVDRWLAEKAQTLSTSTVQPTDLAGRVEHRRTTFHLTWTHVDLDGDLDGDPHATPPVPPHVMVWRSVRAGDDTKTRKSRRTLALPLHCVSELRGRKALTARPGCPYRSYNVIGS
jgi:hypothetical protein